ncbi:hypothetical protein [Alkalihalobacterium chitinilyticum]|uniref:Uncharacterized protein n=1 Tax=Alkalihalobacterium chitinilyticum TaxID=2980103 RepID=A0ABT5VHN3_9BACI|nr:hypothetical protein [Alkalihalobacterium chitinilyticum]MDE5414956.1 hypothetical protein [Alkalihalobacterium chitinilyticum]
MFEVTFDLPVIWLLLGVSMVYITAALSRRVVHWHFQRKDFAKRNDRENQILHVMPTVLIVLSFILIKRKIPNSHDRNSKNDDDANSSLLLNS